MAQNKTRAESKLKKKKHRRDNSTDSRSTSSSSSRSSSRSQSRNSSPSRRSHSRSTSRSPTPRTRSPPKHRSTRRSRSRSLTPPSFNSVTQAAAQQDKIDQSNRGHQLLQKMGWSGSAGLGRNEQGICIPIEGGEIRDRVDMYKGVGARSDPFEQFRRNRSQTYIQRIRTRDEERDSELSDILFVCFGLSVIKIFFKNNLCFRTKTLRR
jgi:calcium homeostasis ER protein